jgi:hypothetical protein
MQLDNISKKMEENSNYPSDFFKFSEGDNKMRVMTDFIEVHSLNDGKTFKGLSSISDVEEKKWISEGAMNKDGYPVRKASVQGWAWAIIRNAKDGDELKIVKFGSKILSQLVAYRHNPEYAFENAPLPYDITIKAVNAGQMTVEYTVIPARQNTEVTADEMAKLNKKKTIETIVQAIKDKQEGKVAVKTPSGVEYPKEEIDAQDIPF